MELVKYLETGYRMKLLVLRGMVKEAGELFELLSPEERQFRAFKRIEQMRLARADNWPACLVSFFSVKQGPYRTY